MGRKKEFAERIQLPLPEGMTAELDAIREAEETRLDVIREALAREIRRRRRKASAANED